MLRITFKSSVEYLNRSAPVHVPFLSSRMPSICRVRKLGAYRSMIRCAGPDEPGAWGGGVRWDEVE